MADILLSNCTLGELFGALFGLFVLVGLIVGAVVAVCFAVRQDNKNQAISRRELVNEIVKEIEKRRFKK